MCVNLHLLVIECWAQVIYYLAFPEQSTLYFTLGHVSQHIIYEYIYIGSTLVQHWFNIDSTLVQHWFNIGSTLVQHWFNIDYHQMLLLVNHVKLKYSPFCIFFQTFATKKKNLTGRKPNFKQLFKIMNGWFDFFVLRSIFVVCANILLKL